MRLFCAIDLSDTMKEALTGILRDMKKNGVKGNYTKRENFHITLAFIGEYPDPDSVIDTLEAVRFAPFDLSLEGVGSFGSLWWAGLSRSEELAKLAKSVRHVLADAEIPFDRKKFSPHITLIRQPNREIIPPVEIPKKKMTVQAFSLFRSDRGKDGVIYTEIASFNGDR